MKFRLLVLVAAGALVVPGVGAFAQSGSLLDGAQVIPHKTHSVVVPASSLERPEDLGEAAHTNVRFVIPAAGSPRQAQVTPAAPPFPGYGYETPASLACVYGLAAATAGCNPNSVTAVPHGGSRAIAIVDAYSYPNALADLQLFSEQFGLLVPTANNFKVVFASGVQPPRNLGWELEQALDVQYAHAMAPNAVIYLVEAASNSFSDLLAAVDKASNLVAAAGGGQVSMSWGASEFAGQTNYDSHFSKPNVVYFASSGDAPGVSWPSTSEKVVSVGGSSISRAYPGFNFEHLSSWDEGGGGVSQYVVRPSYQSGIAIVVGTMRGVPDIAADANPDTGAWVYDSGNGGWLVVGGTSLASPVLAGIVNASGSFAASTNAELTKIYGVKSTNAAAFGTPSTGYCGFYATYSAVTAWNFCTGVGSPRSLTTQ